MLRYVSFLLVLVLIELLFKLLCGLFYVNVGLIFFFLCLDFLSEVLFYFSFKGGDFFLVNILLILFLVGLILFFIFLLLDNIVRILVDGF